jgi:membrane associated rhomboid family serine protease
MIPLRDDIPTETLPVVTIFLLAANSLAFFYQLSLGPAASEFIFSLGVIPFDVMHGVQSGSATRIPLELTFFTSMFLHGGLLHLGGNMMFLWIFGNNVEDSIGHVRFLLFYLLCGLAAAGAHVWLNPGSRLPMIGASGAISGILGAYFLLYPRARVLTLIPIGFFLQTVLVPAAFFLGFWFLLQIFSGWSSFGSEKGGVAWFAHVGGFLAGLLLLLVFKKRKVRLWSRRTGWQRRAW